MVNADTARALARKISESGHEPVYAKFIAGSVDGLNYPRTYGHLYIRMPSVAETEWLKSRNRTNWYPCRAGEVGRDVGDRVWIIASVCAGSSELASSLAVTLEIASSFQTKDTSDPIPNRARSQS